MAHTQVEPLARILANLRHLYQQLNAVDFTAWPMDRRIELADRLLAPEIIRLEAFLASGDPVSSSASSAGAERVDPKTRVCDYTDLDPATSPELEDDQRVRITPKQVMVYPARAIPVLAGPLPSSAGSVPPEDDDDDPPPMGTEAYHIWQAANDAMDDLRVVLGAGCSLDDAPLEDDDVAEAVERVIKIRIRQAIHHIRHHQPLGIPPARIQVLIQEWRRAGMPQQSGKMLWVQNHAFTDCADDLEALLTSHASPEGGKS